MIIRGQELNINFEGELEPYTFGRSRVRGNKLQGCSPFRNEKSPSFAVNLENGLWVDSGADSEEFRKGNFTSLLAFLREASHEDTEDYLIEKYGFILKDVDSLTLNINLLPEKRRSGIIPLEKVKNLMVQECTYLDKRGISREVQQLFMTGYEPSSKSISIPWMDSKGNVINVKYRNVNKKTFYYEKEGSLIKYYVYGIYQVNQINAKRVCICESEIDALTLWTHGFQAIATGGSSLSEEQKRIIMSSGIEELVICTDNDTVGHRFREFLKGEFGGLLKVYDIKFPKNKKDINELSIEELREVMAAMSLYTPSFII